MPNASPDLTSLEARLHNLYGDRAGEALSHIQDALRKCEGLPFPHTSQRWSQQDVILITYGDQIRSTEANPD